VPDSPLGIRWLKRALANLDAEAAFIARDHPAAAARVVEAITTTVELLAQHPSLGRPGPPRARRGQPRVGGPRYSVPGPLPRARPRC
jgi:toxin ParE1/3/4